MNALTTELHLTPLTSPVIKSFDKERVEELPGEMVEFCGGQRVVVFGQQVTYHAPSGG